MAALLLNKLLHISQALWDTSFFFSFQNGRHVSMLRLTYMLSAFPSSHDSWEMLTTFQPLVYFGISDGRVTGVACTTQSNAWPSITTQASAGPSYLGQTQGPLRNQSMGSFQTSVLVKVSIQRKGREMLNPTGLLGKEITEDHLPVQGLLG